MAKFAFGEARSTRARRLAMLVYRKHGGRAGHRDRGLCAVLSVSRRIRSAGNRSRIPSGGLICIRSPATIAQAIIRNFELVIDKNPTESVKGLLHLSAVSDVVLDEIAAAAISMARDRISNLIFKKLKPTIVSSNFQTDVRAFIRKHNLANLLISKVPEPSPDTGRFLTRQNVAR